MEEHIRAYARLRLKRAYEDLETARENLGNNRLRAAVNRAYYAIFHIASAALFSQSIRRSKHPGVESAFAQFLVKPGHIEKEFSRLYQRARRQREEADYADDMTLDKATVQQSLTDTERFIERIAQFLREIDAL